MLFTMLLIQKHSIISEKLLFEFIRIIVRIYLNFFTVFEFLCLFEPFWTSYHVKNWQLFKAFFRCVAAFSRLFLINQLCIRAGDEKKKTPICCRYFWRMAVFTVRRRRLRRRRKRMGLASATKCKGGGGGEGGEGWITDFFSSFLLSFLPFLPFFFMGRRQRRQRNSEVPSVKSYSRNFWSFLGRIVWVFIGCIRLQYKVGLSLESLFLISSAASPSKTLHISRGTEQKMSIVWKRISYFDAIPRWAKTNSDRFVFYALNLTVWYL